MVNVPAFLTSATFGFVLKLIATMAAAAFGIFGLGAKTREDDGRLSRKGWVVLLGILIAGLLAIATSIYEFAAGRERAEADRHRAERLLVSVQRGIFPMRGITASVELQIGLDFDSLTAYKAVMGEMISRDPKCRKSAGVFQCYGVDHAGGHVWYRIPVSSPLFPSAGSQVRSVLDAVYIRVAFYRAVHTPRLGSDSLVYLGRFFVDWRDRLPTKTWLIYDYVTHALSIRIENVEVPDDVAGEANIYSLVDLAPGIVAVAPNVYGDALCEQLRMTTKACGDRVLNALDQGIFLENFELKFWYPKAVVVRAPHAFICPTSRGRQWLVRLPADIEDLDNLGNVNGLMDDSPPRRACAFIAMTS